MKRVVWIISEGSPGHVSQSEGLVAALAQQVKLEPHIIQTSPRFGGIIRSIVRLWMGRAGQPLSDGFLKSCLGCRPPTGVMPNLIVTSGGKAVFTARSLAVKHGAPLVFLGERKPYPARWFHTVFTPSPFETDVTDVPLEMIPTGITPAKANAAASAWRERPNGCLWAMIIGGASASHEYTDADWKLLALKMNTLAEAQDIRWLVSTSRRTGARAETILREHLVPKTIARAVWWAEKPEKLMAEFLGSATWVCVTQDSVTMVTEAVASGRPVLVTMPAKTEIKPTSFLHGYYNRLEKASRIVRVPIAVLGSFHPGDTRLLPRSRPINCELAATLLSRLHWPVNH
ncbi:MAG: ELM1/GtrOC1 family putative glycosyltransferase [Luteolibacter sp.]|uniref:ELM1/GtrOC1 family putative glycosyltransferase n=1 Tax=Luteolibacter sp. TaxID=1962973 RepID=UPI003262DD89